MVVKERGDVTSGRFFITGSTVVSTMGSLKVDFRKFRMSLLYVCVC